MKRSPAIQTLLLCIVTLIATAKPCQAVITLDYTHDTNTDNFFATNTTARDALEAAVADINAVLDLSAFGAITAAQSVITGSSSSGNANVDFTFEGSYTNPSLSTQTSFDPNPVSFNTTETLSPQAAVFNAGEIRIYVGMRELNSTTLPNNNNAGSVLGQGGPRVIALSVLGASGTGGATDADFAAATLDAAAQANAIYGRGSGPTITNQSGPGFGNSNYSIDLGVTHGNLWFDIDTDNDGMTDDPTTLSNSWHFDHTTTVAAGKSDFYSVALHETLHAIGYGVSDSWDSFVTDDTPMNSMDDLRWTGGEVLAELGLVDGSDLIDAGGGHFASSVMSERIDGGGLQDAVMTSSITTGTRKYLTEVDLAALRDIGFTVSAVPEPSSIALLAVATCLISVRRRRR